jgi:antitoxin MazE
MHTQLTMWGNSLAVRIPKALAQAIAAAVGSDVTITVEDGALVIRPAASSYNIDELVKKITPKNRHAEIDSGAPVGHEIL